MMAGCEKDEESSMLPVQMKSRQERLLGAIHLSTMEGVEIGPLASPIVTRDAGRILYADHASTEVLRRKYVGHGWDTAAIVDVDVDLSSRTLSRALGDRRVDFVLASHVIEHVPDPVSWLGDLREALRPGGIVSLAIPDKRFCFDAKRPESTPGELVDAFLSRRAAPTVKQVFDFWACYCQVDAQAMWSGAIDAERLSCSGTLQNALQKSQEAVKATGYTDVHCWVFTPRSFLEAAVTLAELGMFPFQLADFASTPPGDIEFFVSLRRVESDESESERALRVQSLRAAALEAASAPGPARPTEPPASRPPEPPASRPPELAEATLRLGRPLYHALAQAWPGVRTLRDRLRPWL
ncbi:class I SAM-dependent methyltransferase [Corallococcus sp. ZKHCc1 1396]|uniref:Class I SAM-dependent methyltransferase n=1 Tax=Corallococcus soli TaxID=2710757 RepID=A0ABR9PRH0_9BACT|nr:class I SAM-dependent methyltransferase [Corallococcus soli]MBE4750522.1 class I SAM-dependent methyltransferase [Corallococcus soli]